MSEEALYRELGATVQRLRKELGLSQAEVAARLGLTRASMANLENGRQRLMLHHLYRLTAALELDSILDLVRPTWSFEDPSTPARYEGSKLTRREQVTVEDFLKSVSVTKPKPAGTRR